MQTLRYLIHQGKPVPTSNGNIANIPLTATEKTKAQTDLQEEDGNSTLLSKISIN